MEYYLRNGMDYTLITLFRGSHKNNLISVCINDKLRNWFDTDTSVQLVRCMSQWFFSLYIDILLFFDLTKNSIS